MTQTAPSISASDVSVSIDGTPVLHDISCAFAGGGVTGLVGQNGSGKSTLMRVLARQIRPNRGTIHLAGETVSTFSDRAFARMVAYLPQSLPAAPGMTVRELVALGRYPWHGALGRFGEEDRRQVDEALLITDTAGLAERSINSLSGGERQRCWLAMLMAQNARLLLLDEPTSALDLAHQYAVLRLLGQVCHARGVAAIVILHDINLAAQFCDRIVAMKFGRLIAEGTPFEVMTPDTLGEIYGVPVLVAPHPQTQAPYCFVDASQEHGTSLQIR